MRNRLLSFIAPLLLCAFALTARATFIPTNQISGLIDWSSYHSGQGSGPSYVAATPFKCYVYAMYPQWTNQIYPVGGSGANWQQMYESNEEKTWLSLENTFRTPGSIWVLPQDNGGYGSNAVIQWGTNIASFPPYSWDGTARTQQNISVPTLTYYFQGGRPDSTLPFTASLSWLRYTASTNLNAMMGTAIMPMHEILRTNGWHTNSLMNDANGHPTEGGGLLMSMIALKQHDVETNVGSWMLDWQSGTVATNHWAVSSVIISGNTRTFTAKADRMPMGWLNSANVTNDGRQAFIIAPETANWFQWPAGATNLPNGDYSFYADGTLVNSGTATNGFLTWNWFTNYAGPLWAQRQAVTYASYDEEGVDYTNHNTHSAGTDLRDLVNYGSKANEQYGLGLRGTNLQNALVLWTTPILTNWDVRIHNAAVQTNHTFQIVLTTTGTNATLTASAPTNALNVPVILDGTSSINASNYVWSQLSGPAQLELIGQGTAKALIISATNAGSYVFQLAVTDGSGVTSYATTNITFIAPTGRTIFADTTLAANCLTTNYSIASRNNSGSDAVAYTNIQMAVNAAAPGDLVYIRSGLYTNNPASANQTLVNVTNIGTATAPIRLEAYNGESVVLGGWGFSDADTNADGLADGPAFPAWRQTLLLIPPGSRYIQVKGLELTNSQQGAMAVEASFCYVQECIVHDNWTAGASITRMNAATNTLTGTVFRWMEAYRNRHFTGISMGLEDQTTYGSMSDCAFVDCVSYRNGYDANGVEVLPIAGDPQGGGNSDGMSATKYFADNALVTATNGIRNYGTNLYFLRSILFSNCDDGLDISCAKSLIEDNRSIGNGPTGMMGYKIFRPSEDMVYRGNVAYGNQGRGYDLRGATNSYLKLWNNDAFKNGAQGFIFAGDDATALFIASNNVAAWDTQTDWPTTNAPNWGADGNNVGASYRGNPVLVNSNLALSTTFPAGWTVKQKHDYLEGQIKAALSPAIGSPLAAFGVFIVSYFCATADNDSVSPMPAAAYGRHWLTPAPDLSAYAFTNTPSLNYTNAGVSRLRLHR